MILGKFGRERRHVVLVLGTVVEWSMSPSFCIYFLFLFLIIMSYRRRTGKDRDANNVEMSIPTLMFRRS
jgi:hypothetical protein